MAPRLTRACCTAAGHDVLENVPTGVCPGNHDGYSTLEFRGYHLRFPRMHPEFSGVTGASTGLFPTSALQVRALTMSMRIRPAFPAIGMPAIVAAYPSARTVCSVPGLYFTAGL